jgi:tetratricopeptide (TPR) repeat protein
MAINKNKVMEVAQKLVEKGQLDKAIKEYLKIVEEDAKDVRVWLKLGDLYAKKNAKQDATDTYLKVAQFYGDQGFYLKAVAVYKQVLKLDPRLIEVNIKLAEVYRQLGLLSDAMQQYELVAAFYHREGKTREALATIRELVELDPENVATRIKLAELYSKEQMVREAVIEFTKAAETLRASGRMDDFIKVGERLVWHQPDNHAMNRELAQLYLKRNDPRHALQKLQACFKADPRDVPTLGLLASAFLALDQKPKTVSVWKEMARILTENNQPAAAAEIYRRILAVDPEDPDAQAAVGGRRAVGSGNPQVPRPPAGPRPVGPAPSAASGPVVPISFPSRAVTPMAMEPAPRPPSRTVPPIAPPMAPPPIASPPAVVPAPMTPPPPVDSPAPPPAVVRPAVARSTGPAARLTPPPAPPPPPPAAVVPVVPPARPLPPPPPRDDYSDGVALEIDEEKETTSRALDATMVDAELELGIGEPIDERDRQAEQIAKILSEADVYVKYGIREKAIEHLHRVFDIDARNLEARERLKEVYLAFGRDADAADQLAKLVELTGALDRGRAGAYLRELGALRPGDARARELTVRFRLKAPPTPMPAAPDDGEGSSADIPIEEASQESSLDEGTVEVDPAELAVEIGEPEDEAAVDTDFAFDEVSATGPDKTDDSGLLPGLDDLVGLPVGAEAGPQVKEVAIDPEDEVMAESLAGGGTTPGAPRPPGVVGMSLEDDLDEADFFVSQNLFDEARAILNDLLARHPSHPLILAKLRDLEGAATSPPAPKPDEPGQAPSGEQAPITEKRRRPAVIAKGLSGPDVDTHYDLGLAYKEMGLYDEAVKEFTLVRAVPGRAAQCHMMIGLCQLERGKLAEAVEEFKAGLYVDGITERESISLYFELGAAYEALGDTREATYYFEKVQKREPGFRDADRRLESLRRGGSAGGVAGGLPRSNGARARTDEDSGDEAMRAIDSLGEPGDLTPP